MLARSLAIGTVALLIPVTGARSADPKDTMRLGGNPNAEIMKLGFSGSADTTLTRGYRGGVYYRAPVYRSPVARPHVYYRSGYYRPYYAGYYSRPYYRPWYGGFWVGFCIFPPFFFYNTWGFYPPPFAYFPRLFLPPPA